jgi:hypothetical protein
MASDSATAIATQQSIKAYVDSQVGTVDTLSEILANGNTTGANDIDVDSAQKVQFRDADIYLNSSVDGQLDIVADTEIQIAATTVDLNGDLDVSGTALVAGVLTTTAATVFNGGFASNADSTLGTDKKVQFRDAAIYLNSSVDGQLDIVADTEIQIAATTVDLNGNLDVSGTALVTGVLTTTAATVFNGGFASNADSTLGTDKKVQFRDSAIYINSSADGQLDLVADTEIQIAATTIDVNGTLAFDSLKGTGATTVTNILDEDNMASDSATAIATQQSIKAYVDSQVGSFDTLAEVLAQGNTTGGTDLAVSTGDDITFADNSKAIFGAGSDLQIYHDGSHSYIKDGGTGDLRIWADSPNIATASGNKIFFGNSGYAELYAAGGAIRLATTATGITGYGRDSKCFWRPLTLDVAGDIILDADTGVWRFKDAGTTLYQIAIDGASVVLYTGVSDAAMVFKGNDGGSTVTALTLDMSAAGAATFNSTIAATSATFTTADNLPQLTLVSTDADALVGPQLNLWRNSGSAANGDLIGQITFTGEDSLSNTITYASIHGVADQVNNGAEDGSIRFSTRFNDVLAERLAIGTSTVGVTINDTGIDADFRVESDTITHALFVEGSSGNVGINNSAPYSPLSVTTTGTLPEGQTWSSSVNMLTLNGDRPRAGFSTVATTGGNAYDGDMLFYTMYYPGTGDYTWYERMRLTSKGALITTPVAGGHAVFNEGGVDADFRVESDTNTHALFVDAGNDRVGIGRVPTVEALEVAGNLKLEASNAEINIKAGVGGTSGGVNWTFNTDATNFASMSLDYDTRSTVGLNLDSGYPITIDASVSGNYGISFQFSGVENHLFNSSGATFNQGGSATLDFRVESDNNANMLFVDASVDRVGVGATPMTNGSTFQVTSDSTESTNMQLTLRGASDTNKQMIMGFDTTADTAHITTQIAGSAPTPLIFKTGNVVFNEAGSDL